MSHDNFEILPHDLNSLEYARLHNETFNVCYRSPFYQELLQALRASRFAEQVYDFMEKQKALRFQLASQVEPEL